MSKWSDPKWIREEVKRKWDSGRILGAVLESMPAFILEQEQKQEQEQEKDKYISSSVIFPMRIALIKPHRNEINVNFNKVSEWAELLRSNSKQAIGYGYELLEKEMAHSLLGRNRLPSHAVIPSIDDAVMMIKKRSDVDKFVSLTHTILSEWPIISVWIKSHPLKILKYADDWAGILKVLHWFSRNPACGLYIRQLDIPGVDTKFIENKTGILSELM